MKSNMKSQIKPRVKGGIAAKLVCLALASVMFAGLFAACGGNTPEAPGSTEEPEGENEAVIITDIDAKTYYRDGYTTNYVVGIDQFERTVNATSGEKTDKSRDVGIFYFLTLGQHGGDYVVNITETLENYPREQALDLLFYSDSNELIRPGTVRFWGEPLYGYYNSADVWVIRRHLALLTMAGVDFLVFDTTNAVTYDGVVSKIIKEVKSMLAEGWNVPKLVFYTNAYSHRVISNLYNNYYRRGKNDEVWYRIDGKPLIIGNITAEDDLHAFDDGSYKPGELSEEIRNYFTIRESQWPYDPVRENGFPWIEWSYPAPVHNGVINVAVASHPELPMSFSITRGTKNWGRGWNVETYENESDKILQGQYFQSTWDVALKEDPGIVFITGWNEWVAGGDIYEGEHAMVDLCNLEFSRDAEMMKGGYNDAFYIQIAKNIRAYKYVEIPLNGCLNSEPVTVPMTSDLSVWDNAYAVFRDTLTVNKARNFAGAVSTLHYDIPAARNNINEVRIAQDADNIYFLVRTEENITSREAGDNTWMNLFIGTGAVAAKGWEGYEYVIGRSETDGKLTVEKLAADFSGEDAGTAEYVLSGNTLQIKVPRSALGLNAQDNNLYFKVADGVENPSDIMDYYVTGDSFPMGRLSYRYIG